MKVLMVYESTHHGNTKKLVDAVAAAYPVDTVDIRQAGTVRLEDYDVIGIASGIAFGKFYAGMEKFAEQCLPADIHTYGDALWYCYAVISTAGFGDIVVTTAIGKIISAIITIYSVFVIAIVTGVVVNFYNQVLWLQQEETLASFLDRMERLPEMTEEKLREMSKKAAFFRQKRSDIKKTENRKLDF